MELTELRLAPKQFVNEKSSNSSSCLESEKFFSKKRKLFSDCYVQPYMSNGSIPIQTSVDLHVKDPLPVDWEQCLDLESGKVYYLNRKTLRKSWDWPNNYSKEQNLDLELNISTLSSTSDNQGYNSSCCSNNSSPNHQSNKATNSTRSVSSSSSNYNCNKNNNNNMVALACLNCHLLVILSISSPSCPNCKFVHSLQQNMESPLLLNHKVSPSKSNLNTLSRLDKFCLI